MTQRQIKLVENYIRGIVRKTLNESENSLDELNKKLQKLGYNSTIPAGSNKIVVMGMGKKFFAAKKAKALSILANLKSQGFNAEMKLDPDGYYDFLVSVV